MKAYWSLARVPHRWRWLAIEPRTQPAANLFLGNFTEVGSSGCFDPCQAPVRRCSVLPRSISGFIDRIGWNTAFVRREPPGNRPVSSKIYGRRSCALSAPGWILRLALAGRRENGELHHRLSGPMRDSIWRFKVCMAKRVLGRQAHRLTRSQARQAFGATRCRKGARFAAEGVADQSGYPFVQRFIQR